MTIAEEVSDDFNERLAYVMEKLEKEEAPDAAAPQKELAEGQAPDAEAEAEKPIGEDKAKPNGAVEDKPAETSAIEPPASWPSDDKEAFQALPSWAQERIVTREREREAYFTQRSTAMAQREREISDLERRAAEASARYMQQAQQLQEIQAQLLPAKFADIQTEADYIKAKRDDPARASEYEAFMMTLTKAQQEAQSAQQAQLQQHLAREYEALQAKDPVFREPAKAQEILDGVRKTATEFYGFSPEEVKVIADHRYVQVIRDAQAWRDYQKGIKLVEAKKAAPAPATKVIKQAAVSSNQASSDHSALLNRARQTENIRDKAAMLARIIEAG